MAQSKLYLIGSLRNDTIPKLARSLRDANPDVEVFDDWYAAGPEADDYWKEYEKARGRSYEEALKGYAARHVFEFDRGHLESSTHCLLVLPAGKSGHMEVMYAKYGVGADCGILLDPDDVRWDVMYQFIPNIFRSEGEVNEWLRSGSAGTGDGREYTSPARGKVRDIQDSRRVRGEDQFSLQFLSQLGANGG